MIEEGRRNFLPSNCITLNDLFVVAHQRYQTALMYWQTVWYLIYDHSSYD